MTVKDLEGLLKKGIVKKGNDPFFNLEKISTGIPRLDHMLGGGLIRGRMMLVVGEYSSGKSYLAQRILKQAQDAGLTTALVDTEQSYDIDWAERIGLNTELLHVRQTSSGEDVIDTTAAFLEAKTDVIVVDSIMGMIPDVEIEASATQQFMQLHPRLVSRAVRKWLTANTSSVLILVNHIRAMEHIPGGDAQQYFSSVILRVKRAGWIKSDRDTVLGFTMRLILKKSKQSKPWTRTEIPFRYDGLLDEMTADIDFALDTGIIQQGGAWYNYEKERFQGKGNVIKYFNENPDKYQELQQKLLTVVLPEAEEDEVIEEINI